MSEHTHLIRKLERQYAVLRGKFNDADRAAETVHGLHAIREKWIEIESTKKLLKRQMDQIAGSIRQFDPDFDVERIKPLRPQAPAKNGHAKISRGALAVLRAERRPMTSREIARKVAARLGLSDISEREITRIDSAVTGSLVRRVERGVVKPEGENPRRWVLV